MEIAGDNATSDQIADIREKLGLNEPIWTQFAIWIGDILQGKFGESYFFKKTVAELIAYDRATIGGVIERLEQKGWVDRVVSERDRRARVLSLTAEGERILQALVPVVRNLQDEILQALGEADRARFLKLARQAVGS